MQWLVAVWQLFNLDFVIFTDTNTPMDTFALNDAFMVPTDKFFHYNGSLTTPTCNEAVQWVVFTGVTMISHDQVKIYIISNISLGRSIF